MIVRLPAVAALAAGLTASVLTLTPSVAAPKKPIFQCMTDDGYGRYRPCDASYKKANPNWRATDKCMTDDGYGRYRPCSQLYRQGISGNPSQYGSNSTFPAAKKQPGY
jgi:hypothetical protein